MDKICEILVYVVGFIIIALFFAPWLKWLKLEKILFPKYFEFDIVLAQIVLVILFFQDKIKFVSYGGLLSLAILSLLYLITEKSFSRYNFNLSGKSEDFNYLIHFAIMSYKYFNRVVFFFSIVMIPMKIFSNVEIFDLGFAVISFFLIIQMLAFEKSLIDKALGFKGKYASFLFFFCIIFVGLLSPEWWEGISIMVSIIGLAFTKRFIKTFTVKEISDQRALFYQLLIPCLSFLFFLSLVINHDLITEERLVSFFSYVISFANTNNVDIKGNLTASKLLSGFSKIATFFILLVITYQTFDKFIFKKNGTKFFNNDFKSEFYEFVKTVKDKVRDR